jgi:general L-amino acid transport system substrate-binding protein
MLRKTAAIAVAVILIMAAAPNGFAGEILNKIKSRGTLRCGVSADTPGFASRDAAGKWTGLEVEFCRAVAAATLGDPAKTAFIPLKPSERLPAIRNSLIDLLLDRTTWTFSREAILQGRFPGILFFDSQGFLVRAGSGLKKPADLNGRTICIVKETIYIPRTEDYFAGQGWRYQPLVLNSAEEALQAFMGGRCQAYISDRGALVAAQQKALQKTRTVILLPERLSSEPFGPVVLRGDDDWATLVRWVLNVLVFAEDIGVTRDNLQKVIRNGTKPDLKRAVENTRIFARPLGLPEDWVFRVISAVGNYGEMFDRTVGRKGGLGLERGPNRPVAHGGWMFVPPFYQKLKMSLAEQTI